MAKVCSICGKKLGFLSGKVTVSDGIVCDSCWFAAGLDLSINSMMTSNTRTVNQLRDMIEIEVLKRAAELTGRTDLAAAAPKAEAPAEKAPAVKQHRRGRRGRPMPNRWTSFWKWAGTGR